MENKVKLYHIDRKNVLREGMEIQLLPHPQHRIDVSKFDSKLDSFVQTLFSKGISLHGDRYLRNSIKTGGKDIYIESIFETIRACFYPDRLSRFQSFFAFNHEGVHQFIEKNKLKPDSFSVYEVSCDHFEKYDMELLRGESHAPVSYFAHQYWQGEVYENPHFEYLLRLPVEIGKKSKL